MNEELFNRMNKNLYDIENILEMIKENFEEYNKYIKDIDIEKFLQTIKLYISNFDLLKNEENKNLIILLDEKLQFLLNNYYNMDIYFIQIIASMKFIEKHENTFFKNKQNSQFLKHSFFPAKRTFLP